MKTPLVFDIKRGSLDDGDGIRTVIFFKGCPLNCFWCHNPESINPQAEYFFDPERCISCKEHSENCPSGAFRRIGKNYSIEELLAIIIEDNTFYKVSGGGVTFSGGEPTLYMEYLGKLALELKKSGVSCFLETSGFFDFNEFKKLLLPYFDCILYDIKLIDSAEHIKYTGKDNKIIIENLHLLSRENIKVVPRTPLIPGITDTEKNLTGILNMLRELELDDKYVKLTFNDTGEKKRKMLRSQP
ncbi:MAG: radical SAM protein [Spirochaetes bacterium]|nr:radical SAM protein [Spirochaetota bacterium]